MPSTPQLDMPSTSDSLANPRVKHMFAMVFDLNRLKIDRKPTTAAAQPRRRGGMGWLLLLLLLCLLGGAGWVFRVPLMTRMDRWRLPAVKRFRVEISTPMALSSASGVSANGYIIAAKRAALSADIPGRIVELNVVEGSQVAEGDVVARLDSTEYEAALRRAQSELHASEARVAVNQAELASARAGLLTLQRRVEAAEARESERQLRLVQARRDLARISDLRERQMESKRAYDDAVTAFDSASAQLVAEQATLQAARAELTQNDARIQVSRASVREARTRVQVQAALRDEAAARLDKTYVRAPFDGIVVLKDAELGEIVGTVGSNSRGSVATMVDFASLEVQIDLPESNLAIAQVDATAHVFLDAYPSKLYSGRVARIWPTANRQKATVEVRVVFDAPDSTLRPEMGVRVVFSPEQNEQPEAAAPTAEPAMLIPELCLIRDAGQPGVFVLERGIVYWRPVTLSESRSRQLKIESGLQPGEYIVFDPPVGLADGDRVQLAEE